MAGKLKIFLVDDHEIFRNSLKALLIMEGIADVVGEASDGKEFLEIIDTKEPDIILMDIEMKVMDGVEATTLALKKYPKLKILALSMYGDEFYYQKMVQAGVKGFILKTTGINELLDAIYQVADGDNYFSDDLLRRIIVRSGNKQDLPNHQNGNIISLSKRETEILQEICNGLTNKEIAVKHQISPKTVKTHRTKILSKTGCKNTASLVMYSIKNNLIKI
jgi:DNA-binding NarL/FixJ family response regulator